MLDLVSDHSANKRITLAKGIFKVLCNSSSSGHLFIFLYPIGSQRAQFFRRALHYASGGRKFLCQSAQPLRGSVYIVIHRQTVLFRDISSLNPALKRFVFFKDPKKLLWFSFYHLFGCLEVIIIYQIVCIYLCYIYVLWMLCKVIS